MIEAISIVIAILGILLLLILYSQIQNVGNELKLRKHRSKQDGLVDLLNYAAVVDDGVIVGKNGSFMAAWIYTGDDHSSSTDNEKEYISAQINKALSQLGNGWMIHVDAVRRPAGGYPNRNNSAFPDAVSAAVDEERRRLFEGMGTMYEGRFFITLTYFPPMLVQRKFAELMFDDDTDVADKHTKTRQLVESFKRECNNIETRLSSVINLSRLRARKHETEDGKSAAYDDFLAWLQYCITGLNNPVLLPSNPMYLDAVLGGQELWTGTIPKIGRNFIQVVAIEGFPLESSPGILNTLAEIQCEYRWSSRFIFMDQHEAIAHYEKFRKKWKQKIRGFFDQLFNTQSGHIDLDAQLMVDDAQAAIAEINSGLVSVGYYTSTVVLFNEDRETLERISRNVEKRINALGFAARVETVNTMDAYLGSLPGHGVENVRRPLINTMNLADFLPTSTIWTGSEYAPCPHYPEKSPAVMHCVTNGATPFRLNLHVRDLGHSLIFGPTRAGKSTLLAILSLQLRRYSRMSVFAFDKGMSLYPTTKAVGGLHFSVGADGNRLAFCPLKFIDSKGDRAWAMEWIEVILALNGVNVTPVQRNAIGEAIFSMQRSGQSHRTLSDFVNTVQDDAIRQALKQYTIDGMMGHLLDANEDGLNISEFTCFEIEELMNLGEKYALPVLLYLFRRIESSLHGQPAVIVLDEAWIMLGHPVFRGKIREWLKAFAKKNCAIIMSTQGISDAANSGILDVIVESTATRIFLPNKDARDDEASALYRRMGLNTRQIDILAQAIPKRQYYCVSEVGRRLFELELGPLALSFAGATDKESIATIQQLEERFGDEWVNQWLAIRGLELKDYLVE